jgi:hypothetical protein
MPVLLKPTVKINYFLTLSGTVKSLGAFLGVDFAMVVSEQTQPDYQSKRI